MGACVSSAKGADNADRMRSHAIDRQLEDDLKRNRRECKILLLGSGESGKSTVVKQMKIIHQNGFSLDELRLYRSTVYKNLLECAKNIIAAMRRFGIQPSSPRVREYVSFLASYSLDPDPTVPLNSRVGTAITFLWQDPCIARVLENQNQFYLMDAAP